LTQKNHTFWVFGGGGKEKWSCEYGLMGFEQNSNWRELTHIGVKLSFQL